MENKNYDDIIHLPHKQSDRRPHMPSRDRAAQFAPFSALTGYDDAIDETARLTSEKIILDEYEIEALNNTLVYISENLHKQQKTEVTYFVPDLQKSGGAYVSKSGCIKQIKEFEKVIIFDDDTSVFIEDILSIRKIDEKITE